MPNTKRKILLGAANAMIQVYKHLLQRTCQFHFGEKLAKVFESSEPVIFAIIHQDFLLSYPLLLKYASGRRFCSLSSLSKDGEIAAYFMEHLGIKAVRGSSSREGLKGFLEMARMIRDEGYSVIFPCDGPRRPYGRVQPGVAMLSSITGIPIYILRTQAKHQIVLEKSPPKLFMPRPFSEITAMEIGPIQIERRCTKENLKKYQAELQQDFDKLIRQTENYFKTQK
jgi:lysophospholipid acyltransferase (LPLAT)-like uncharacterized protein